MSINQRAKDMGVSDLVKRIEKLEEKNKNLKKERDLYKARNEELNENCFGLSKKNENLNIKVASLEGEIKGLNSVIDKLKEENQTIRELEDDLDRIEEIKDREWIKLLNENERLSKELEKKEKSLRAWRKLKK